MIFLDKNVEELITYLRKAILQDEYNYSRVLIDPMYKNVKPYVLDLLHDILRETQLETEKELSSLETNFKQYTNIPDTSKLPDSFVKMIEKTKYELIEIKRKMKNNSYYDYLDSLDIITNINNRLIKVREELIDFRHSSEYYLNNLETNLRDANLHIDEANKTLSKLKDLYFGTIVIALLSLFCFYKNITAVNSETKIDLGIWAYYTIGGLMGIGTVIGKFADADKEFTILTQLFRDTIWGFYACVVYFILLIGTIIINFFSETLSNTILTIMGVVSGIILIAAFIPDKNISKEKTIINDEKRNINNIEAAIVENKLILSTLKSF